MATTNSKCFPDYFSEPIQDEISKWGTNNKIKVYRVGKYGKNDNTAFLNYYDEVLQGLKTVRNKEQYLKKCKANIDLLSISCYENKADIEDYFKITLKNTYPQRILLYGDTVPQCGLSGRTKDRKEDYTNSHVDWWLYKNTTPWIYFEEVNV